MGRASIVYDGFFPNRDDMRRLLFGVFAACQVVTAADAASICASPAELKVLQAAVLQQQLMSASLSCHDGADYTRFVAAFRDRLVQSDRALKQFFLSRKNSEGYTAYKSRIASGVSLLSLHDPRFCENAKIVFDMALKGGGPAHAPSLVQSGYERCRLAVPKFVVASKVPLPARPPAEVLPRPVPPQRSVGSIGNAPVPVPAPRKIRAASGVEVAAVQPALPPRPVIAVRRTPDRVEPVHADVGVVQPRIASVEPPVRRGNEGTWSLPASSHDLAESDHDLAETDEAADDNIPNAYKAGAHWVHNAPVAADDDPPPRRAHSRRPAVRTVLGPDGRWYVVVHSRPNWSDD